MRKVLILGKSAKESSLAQLLAKDYSVFVAPGNPSIQDVQLVDIPNYEPTQIVDFVLENDISLTIPLDIDSVSEELLELFEKNNLQIFVPNTNFINLTKDKVVAKKFLYKLHIPTPRFASFEKSSMAYEYVKNNKNVLIVKSNLNEYATICPNTSFAKTAIDDLTLRNENVLIEEYAEGQTFSIYFISDGYKVLPLGTSQNYNFSLEGDGGVLTNGIGAVAPFFKLTESHLDYLVYSVATPIMEYFEQHSPLVGIWGLEVILTPDDRLLVSNIKHFISDSDAQGVLALLDIDLIKLIDDCMMGVFADMYDYIPQKELFALSCVLSSRNDDEIISGLNLLDEDVLTAFYPVGKNKYLEYTTLKGKVLNLTVLAGTISRARQKLYQEVEEVSFATKNFRKDIGSIMIGNRGLL